MTIATALAEIQANDEKRKRAQIANRELHELLNREFAAMTAKMEDMAKACEAMANQGTRLLNHASMLLEGMAEDLNDEPLPPLNLGEK